MKVALVVPGFSADEADWCIPVLVDLVREMGRHAEVHVFALRYPHRRDRYPAFGASIHTFGGAFAARTGRLRLIARAVGAIAAEHRRGPFDVIHGFWLDEPGFTAVAAGRLLGLPRLASLMGGELARLPEIGYGGQLARATRLLVGWTMRGAGYLTAGCSDGLVRLRRRLPPERQKRALRLPNGIDARVFAASGPPVDLAGDFRLLQVASLLPVRTRRPSWRRSRD
jgi:hypothetical protein